MPVTDPYAVLGVSRDASADDIKSAYRRLARKFHPDVNPDDPTAEEKFKEVGEAYSILSDPERRQRFDQYGVTDDSGMGGGGGYGPGPGAADFGDLFEAFFGGMGGMGGGQANFSRDGDDLRADVSISLRDVLTGCEKPIKVKRTTPCTHCSGTGGEPGSEIKTCDTCNGQGAVRRIANTFLGSVTTTTTCPTCRGTGKKIEKPCSKCQGKKVTVETADLTVNIPAGVQHGTTLRVSGQGGAGIDGGQPGDLYVVVAVARDARFERDDIHLYAPLDITFAQAAMGDQIEAEALDGTVKISIPRGSQPQAEVRIKGRGLPRLRGGARGDLIYVLRVQVPKDLSQERAELLRKFAELGNERIPEGDGQGGGGFLGGLFGKKKK